MMFESEQLSSDLLISNGNFIEYNRIYDLCSLPDLHSSKHVTFWYSAFIVNLNVLVNFAVQTYLLNYGW